MFKRSMQTVFVLSLACMGLAACGNSDDKRPASQVAARVNKEEISVHQVNNLLARAGSLPPDQTKQAAKQVLERLIEQELLVQQALDKKLDRDPKIMQAIESSRREILSRAYLEQVAGAAAKPDDKAIKDFYDANPALFKERRVFNLQELVVAAKPEQIDEVERQAKSAGSVNELIAWLKENNLPVAGSAGVKAAEQLPLELLPRLQAMKDGQIEAIRTPTGVTVINLVASQQRPLDEKAAQPFIEQYLVNQKRTELAQSEVKRLRDKGTIEYVGEFAKAADTPRAAPSLPAAAPAAPAPAGAATDKGIAGLK